MCSDSRRNLLPPVRLLPEPPLDGYRGLGIETRSATADRRAGERAPQPAGVLESAYRDASEQAHSDRRHRLGAREADSHARRGQHEHLRIHDRGSEPERHDRRQGHPGPQHRRDEGDHAAGAERRQGAHDGGEDDGTAGVAGKGTGDQAVRAARGGERGDGHRENQERRDANQGSGDEAHAHLPVGRRRAGRAQTRANAKTRTTRSRTAARKVA